MSKYLDVFEELLPSRKTLMVTFRNKPTGEKVATIKWFPAFRKFAVFPENNIAFDQSCWDKIGDKLRSLNDERIQKAFERQI